MNWNRLNKQIQRALEQLPTGAEWWRETDNGDLIPTLDLYLYLCHQLNINITTTITHEGNYLYRATATLTHQHRQIQTDQLAHIEQHDNEHLSNALAALQSRAVLRACRIYLGPHLKTMRPNARNELLRTLFALYKNYSRQERLEHASYLLNKTVTSFKHLSNAELANLISALVANST